MNPYHSRSGERNVGGLKISALVKQFGSPLFVYDAEVLDHKWKLLRNTFPPEFSIYYSIKANPNPGLIRRFLAKGSGVEIASGGEFHVALASGCPAANMLFAGPGKTESDLDLVMAGGIGEIHIESLLEAERISAIARRQGVRAPIAVRVNPSAEAQGGAMRMGGKPVPFGIDEEQLDIVIRRIVSDPSLEFRGIHLFAGTQILDYTVLIRQYRKGMEIALKVARMVGRPLNTLDFGGGLGIPYFPGEEELDLESLRNQINVLMQEIRMEPMFSGTRFVLEPGRFLVGDAGIYVARVIDIKNSGGKKFLVLDGGMNHHLAASGNLGQVIERNFPIGILNKINCECTERVDVVGPLCTPLDVLSKNIYLPVAEIGDLVGIFQSGAYARTASPLGFLSHPSPPEVLVENGRARLIRRRGNFGDLLADIPGDLQQY